MSLHGFLVVVSPAEVSDRDPVCTVAHTCSRSLKVSRTWRGDRKVVMAVLNLMRDSFFTSISATACMAMEKYATPTDKADGRDGWNLCAGTKAARVFTCELLHRWLVGMVGTVVHLVGDGHGDAQVGAHGGVEQVDGLHDAGHDGVAARRQQRHPLPLVECAAEELQGMHHDTGGCCRNSLLLVSNSNTISNKQGADARLHG